MYQNCSVQKSALLHDVQHLLDLSRAKGGAEELTLLNVRPPQPLAQLIQLLHAHCGQLTGEGATLPSATNRIRFYSQMWPNTHTPAMACRNPEVQGWQESMLWDLVFLS